MKIPEIVAGGVLVIQGQGDLQREFFRAYGYKDSDIDGNLRKRLMLLTILYECSDLRRYAIRLRPEAVDYSLPELEKAIWNFCQKLFENSKNVENPKPIIKYQISNISRGYFLL